MQAGVTNNFNPHKPGTIGDITPAPIFGTTLNITSATGPQVKIGYDTSNYFTISQGSDGTFTLNIVQTTGQAWDIQFNGDGATSFGVDRLAGPTVVIHGADANWGMGSPTLNAGISRFSVNSNSGDGAGITDAGTADTLGWTSKAETLGTQMTLDANFFTINMKIKNNALPTSDPHVAGQWWSNLGIVTVSAG